MYPVSKLLTPRHSKIRLGLCRSLLAVVWFAGFPLLLGAQGQEASIPPLYEANGIRPEGVRQGRLGSCYFHAVVAALAQSRPQMLEKMIQSNSDGTYTVQFADGIKENAYPEDLRYTREIGYDLSEGLWVAVLFRAYAQRVLRRSLLDAIEKADLFPLIKGYVEDFVSSNDPLLLAYDRAIRAQVDQYGNIDRSKLEAQLKEQMKPIAVSDEIKNSLTGMLASGGFFDVLAEVIKQNGELFGAYRAVGQGGIAERVMQTFAGNVKSVMNDSESHALSALERAVKARLPMVACTGGSRFYQQLAAGKTLPAETEGWYVNAHCYTVLGFDANTRRVQLRNPWGRHPDPDGLFNLPLPAYVPAFRGIITTE
jgi:hypothetical protein